MKLSDSLQPKKVSRPVFGEAASTDTSALDAAWANVEAIARELSEEVTEMGHRLNQLEADVQAELEKY